MLGAICELPSPLIFIYLLGLQCSGCCTAVKHAACGHNPSAVEALDT